MNKDLMTRLKRLEQINSPTLEHSVTIELLDNGEHEIYMLIDGKKKVFTEEEWFKSGDAFVKSGDTAALKIDIGEWDGESAPI